MSAVTTNSVTNRKHVISISGTGGKRNAGPTTSMNFSQAFNPITSTSGAGPISMANSHNGPKGGLNSSRTLKN